jgi:hypothetical protein
LAWLQYQELLEDILANKMTESINRGRLSADIVKLLYLNRAIEQQVEDDRRQFTI